ncbi:hypothetical protein [Ectopseudomonas toyotomiensis]|uniref:hypothetical protein n=1 Tax=Ectopseudomonas toyotomiensis TaxID=554344 RepID=UPI003D117408
MRKVDSSKLKVGDIILSTAMDGFAPFIRGVTDSDISHAMICVSESSVMDSTDEGVHARNIEKMFFDDRCALYVMRPVVPVSNVRLEQIISYVRCQTGGPYSKIEAGLSIFRIKLRGGRGQFCSRLVARAYASVGLQLVRAPNFCTPKDIRESGALSIVPDAVVPVSDEDIIALETYGDTTIGMRDVTVDLLRRARSISPFIMTLSDINTFLDKNEKYDARIAAAYRASGYLDYYQVELKRFPWRYSQELMNEAIISGDDEYRASIIRYCIKTLESEFALEARHWVTNLSIYRNKYNSSSLETYSLLCELYENIVHNHKLRERIAVCTLRMLGFGVKKV